MKTAKSIIAFAAAAAISAAAFASPPKTAEIWDGVKMAGKTTEPIDYSKSKFVPPCVSVKSATLDFYLLESEKPVSVVIVCPGGAYRWLSVIDEGEKIAKRLNENGFSAVVLKYRVPENYDGALMDAQRAIRLLRAKAKEWNINPDKIAIMGFSAGASLAARASTNFASQTYEPLDETDRLSARPDATCLIYPAYCSQAEKNRRFSKGRAKDGDSYDKRYEIADWNVVTKDTPPAFITQTQFDPYVDAAIAYYLALKEAKVPAHLHLLPKGQHGYKDEKVFEMYFDWLKSEGF